MENSGAPLNDKPASRTERQRQRVRRRLLDAGRSVVAAKGVAGLRIQEVTDTADVALGSFYNYFESKEEFLEAIITESLSELAATTVGAPEDITDPAEIVALASLRVIQIAYTEPEFARLIANISHSEALFGRALHPFAEEAVARGIAGGRFIVIDIGVLLTSVIGGAFALIREVLDGRHGPGAEEAFARHTLASLGLPPAAAATVVAKVVSSERD
ncbi:TetR/AcrR family transcriptional regulator [Mycolicibacterium helvum]|uniref:TetR family transcriptional regulator n=1 Tax=Mycolicibacterium helvum TaxID=1534349 RepID=A0A7I7TBG8_9MYCO|nr:TetR family transcriptional regulator [Mycolicibacterium helvum]